MTFRTRLTLLNVAVLAVAMSVFGYSLLAVNRGRVAEEIDRDLMRRIMPPPRPPGNREPGMGQGPPPGEGGFGPPRMPPGQIPGQGPGSGFGRGPRQNLGQLGDLEYWRAPKIVSPEGRVEFGRERDLPDPSVVASPPEGPRYRTTVYQGERVRVLSVPMVEDGVHRGTVQVMRELRDFDLQDAQVATTLLAVIPIAVVAAGLIGWFLTDRALRPVGEMTAVASQIGASDLSQRLPGEGGDELGVLARTMNNLLARIEAAYQREKRFTADAAHELRTPLARIQLAASSALAQDPDAADQRRALGIVDGSVREMGALVEDLLLLARAESGSLHAQFRPVDLRLVVANAIEEVGGGISAHLGDRPAWTLGHEPLLRRAARNYLENAKRYGTHVDASCSREGVWVVVRVRDDGQGIDPSVLGEVFEPFRRVDGARTSGSGVGLGLAIVKGAIEAHRGEVFVTSEVGQGSTFGFRVPAAEDPVPHHSLTPKA